MLHRVLKRYILLGFCVVCVQSVSITSIERLLCMNNTHHQMQDCIGTFILPNVVLTTSNCAEKCVSVGKLGIIKTFIHPHYRNFIKGNNYIMRNDIALVVTQPETKKRKLVKLSALDSQSTMGLKALVPIMDTNKPRLAVTVVQRCYIEQPFGYYVCAFNRVTQRTIKVCQERQEQGVPLLVEDRIFGIMGISDKDRCKLPQRIFTAVNPALYWISETVRSLGYNDAVITTLHDMTSTPQPTTLFTFTSATHPTQILDHPTKTTSPRAEETTQTPPTYPPTSRISVISSEHDIPFDPPPKYFDFDDTHHDERPPKPFIPEDYDLNLFDPDHEHNTHPSYPPPTSSPIVTDIISAIDKLNKNLPFISQRYTALERHPTFPKGFTIDPGLIVNLRGSNYNPFLGKTTQKHPNSNRLDVNGSAPKSPYPVFPDAYSQNVLRTPPRDERRLVGNKKNPIDLFRNAHKLLNSFHIAEGNNDFIVPDVSPPVMLPLIQTESPPIMRTRQVVSTRKTQTEKRITAITFVPPATSSKTRATTLSKSSAPKKTTKLTTNRTQVTIPFFKVLDDDKTTNVMDWFKVMVKDKLKNETSGVFYVATTTTTEAYSPGYSSQRPLNFIDLT